MDRVFFAVGTLSAFIAVALGAFAAHELQSRLDPAMLATLGWAGTRWPGGVAFLAGWLCLAWAAWKA